jgi:hypothetical protein
MKDNFLACIIGEIGDAHLKDAKKAVVKLFSPKL